MTSVYEGQRFWKRGNHRHTWVVDAVVARTDGSGHDALLISEDGNASEEVDVEVLADRGRYTRVPEDAHRVEPESGEEQDNGEQG